MSELSFDPEKHEYRKDGMLYTSVTQVISKYCHPFDSDYWSTYKAVKDILTQEMSEKFWASYKKDARGWKNVVLHYKKTGTNLAPELRKLITKRKAEYLHAWDVKGHNARTIGTAVHSWKEKAINGRKHISSNASGKVLNIQVSQTRLLQLQEFSTDRLYAELVISNDQFKVAGCADRVEKYGRDVHIKDYKTSEKIETTSFDNQMMLYPLDFIPDCNYNHYMLQFSFYGWMLERMGYRVASLELQHLLPPLYEEKGMKPYPMTYTPELITLMLHHFRGLPLPPVREEYGHPAKQTGKMEYIDFG